MSLNEAWWAVPTLQQIKAFGHLRGLNFTYFSAIPP